MSDRRFSVTLSDDEIRNLTESGAIRTLIAQDIARQIAERLEIVVEVSLLPREDA